MKIEIGNTKPDNFIDRWPGEFNNELHNFTSGDQGERKVASLKILRKA